MGSIRTATPSDAARVKEIFSIAQRFMVSVGNPNQWAPGYPGQKTLDDDIAAGALKVWVDEGDVPQGCFAFLPGPDPSYARIYDGSWADDGSYRVVHRFATVVQGRGIGSAMMDWAIYHAAAEGKALRVDTHRDNLPMQGLIKSRGFTYCGIIHLVQDGGERLAYSRPCRQGREQ